MIPSEKDVLASLLRITEHLYVQNIQFRGQLRRAQAAGYRDNADKTGLEAAAEFARADFRQRYAQAIQNQEALRVFFESLPGPESIQ